MMGRRTRAARAEERVSGGVMALGVRSNGAGVYTPGTNGTTIPPGLPHHHASSAGLWPFEVAGREAAYTGTLRPNGAPMPLPPALAAVMVAFRSLFSNAVYDRIVVL